MGLFVDIYRSARLGDCTLGGISAYEAGAKEVFLINIEGPFDDPYECPIAVLESHCAGRLRIVPGNPDGTARDGLWSSGGNFAHTSDSRFMEACERLTGSRFYGAVAIHDRDLALEHGYHVVRPKEDGGRP